MTHFFKDMIKRLLLVLPLLIIFCGIKQSPCAKASVTLKSGISYEAATGNLDDASLPSGISSFYSHECPYFILAGGSDVYFKKVTLYIYNSSNTQVYTESVTPDRVFFRYANISVQLSAGSYTYKWEYLVTTGSSSNSYQTITSGKCSFSVSDLTYKLYFSANGGSGAPSSQTKYYGKTLTLSSSKPTRTGYTFLGWSTSSTATSATYQPGGSYTTNSGVTLYAVWKLNEYTVSYSANGGSGAPSSQTKYYGKKLTLSSTKPTRTGYTFLGWSTSSTATSATYQPGGSYTANSGVTLYAVWKLNEYTVSYNANEGSGAPSSQTKYYGKKLTLSSTEPTRTGYSFLGWSTSSKATSATYQPGGSYTTNSGVTLYAVWEIKNYRIIYSANGGSNAPFSQTKNYGEILILSNTIPTRPGYIFLGWSKSSTATSATYQPGGSYTANNDVILYAVWKPIPTQNSNVNNNKENSNPGTQTSTTTTVKKTVTTQKTSSSTTVKKTSVFRIGQVVKIGSLKYKITTVSGSSGTVAVVGATNKKVKKLVIPKNIQKNGISFKITEIAKNAFKNYKNLSFLRIKATTITKIGKNALKGTKRKIQIMVPASKLKKYAKMIKKAR